MYRMNVNKFWAVVFASGQRQARSPVAHSATISGMESGVRWLTLASEIGTFCEICDHPHSLSVIVNHYVILDKLRLADKLQLLVPEELSSDSLTNHYCVASKCPQAYRAIALLFSKELRVDNSQIE